MADVPQLPATQLTPDERTIALLAHMLQIVLWWMAPLTIFFIKRESKFVSFHAMQALLLQVVYLFLLVSGFVVGIAVFILAAAGSPAGRHASPPPELFMFMPLIWLGFLGMGTVVMLTAIVYGVKAGRGEWAEYPVLGPLALKILKLRPGGAPA